MAQSKVLVVEDNQDTREAVSEYLRNEGFSVKSFYSAEQVLETKPFHHADAAVVDITLPGMDGIALTTTLKQRGFDGPIIAITARDTVDDKLLGFQGGMSDYLVKPFDLRELVARLHAQLKKNGSDNNMQVVVTDNFRIDPKRHVFYAYGKEVKLTLVEFRLMKKLLQNNHITVPSEELILAAWGDTNEAVPPLRLHISHLRQKIGDASLTVIRTIPGVGYALNDPAPTSKDTSWTN